MLNQMDNDEGQLVNFDSATLQIAKETDETTVIQDENNIRTTSSSSASHVPSIPFKHVDVHSFFSDRHELVEKAIKDCQDTLATDQDDEIIGTWLLTEISLWDTEKERIVILTKNSLITVKYDFISLKIVEFNRISLIDVDTISVGELQYPTTSIAPRLNGFADGLSSAIQCAVRKRWSSITDPSDVNFEPRTRNMMGLRLMWNKGQPVSFETKWNPFSKKIPFITFTSHPLFWYKGLKEEKLRFDCDAFRAALALILPHGVFMESPLIVENYLGLGAIIHNRNSLGFFKVRGKVSF
ncbi:tumor protein p63-regulated gene 1-like protein isoform X1 [Aphidius gifuensis]|uniref:tumor protein p63-regulated gene 1-like protein isoform X1 n=1 Tax=Aphidius gifuensis TaxID=684658 RepID=UPI001CDBA685|nr:tumor protein p63-regulated gene 1-like protein isoform X1 [Aphidius gifuensis]